MLLCGALALLVSVAVAAPRDALLYDYATQGGSGTVQNVEIRPWGSSQRGVFARRAIAAGEEVFRVPRGRMICEHDLKAHPMRELFDELSGMAAKGHPLAGAVAYALFLISHTRQRESPLKPLLDSFPSYLHHPLLWSYFQVAQLRGSPLHRQLSDMQAELARIYHELARRPDLNHMFQGRAMVSLREFKYAVALVLSRAVGVDFSGADRIVLGDGRLAILRAGEILAVGTLAELTPSFPLASCLVPLADVLNHDSRAGTDDDAPALTHLRYDPQRSELVAIALRNVRPDEQLFLSYGRRSSGDLLLHYGFAEEVPGLERAANGSGLLDEAALVGVGHPRPGSLAETEARRGGEQGQGVGGVDVGGGGYVGDSSEDTADEGRSGSDIDDVGEAEAEAGDEAGPDDQQRQPPFRLPPGLQLERVDVPWATLFELAGLDPPVHARVLMALRPGVVSTLSSWGLHRHQAAAWLLAAAPAGASSWQLAAASDAREPHGSALTAAAAAAFERAVDQLLSRYPRSLSDNLLLLRQHHNASHPEATLSDQHVYALRVVVAEQRLLHALRRRARECEGPCLRPVLPPCLPLGPEMGHAGRRTEAELRAALASQRAGQSPPHTQQHDAESRGAFGRIPFQRPPVSGRGVVATVLPGAVSHAADEEDEDEDEDEDEETNSGATTTRSARGAQPPRPRNPPSPAELWGEDKEGLEARRLDETEDAEDGVRLVDLDD